MDNIEKFRKLFLEFEEETKKKFKNSNMELSDCIYELESKRYNPYFNQKGFITFCRKLRNINLHNVNDNYYLITDDTIKKLESIVEEVKHPYKVENKATKGVYSVNLQDKVRETMNIMNEKSYTHIPVYDNDILVGIFSESSIFQYLIKDKIIEVDDNTIFNDIKECIDINNSKEVVKFVARDELYDDVVNDFINEFKKGHKLSCVMVTNSGKKTEKVIGLITAWDVIGR